MTSIQPTTNYSDRTSIAWVCTAALLALACQSTFAVQVCEFKGKPLNTSDGSQTAGKTGMVLCKDSDTGQTAREYEMRDGRDVGLTRYFRDGKLMKEFTITANGPHEGLEREWARNGQLVMEFTNVNGSVRGLRRQWFDDGKPRKVEWMSEDQRDGAAVEYQANGQLATLHCGPKPLLAPYVNDAKLCGFVNAPSNVNFYSYKGELRSTAVLVAGVEQKTTSLYSNGKPDRQEELLQQGTQKRETFYAEDGVKLRDKLWDVSSRPFVLLRDAEFHTTGALVAERLYQVVAETGNTRRRSRLVSESRFYLNGQPQQKDVYTLDGTTEMRDTQQFTDQGTLSQQGRYALDRRYGERPVGVHQTFFANGKQQLEDTYDAKGKRARQKVWDESGKLVSDDELFEDGSRKAYAK
ncbi:MAG: hypothetical protein ABIZ09_16635 [Rhodoferax sp.]